MHNRFFLTVFFAVGVLVCALVAHGGAYASEAEDDLEKLEQELLGKTPAAQTDEAPSPARDSAWDDRDRKVNISQEFIRAVENLRPIEDKEDIGAFQRRLGALLVPRSKGLELRVLRDVRKRPFSELSPAAAKISTKWYDRPLVVVGVQQEWVKYYAHTVAPKIDAFLRPLAVKVVESSGAYNLIRSQREGHEGEVYIGWETGPWREPTEEAPAGCSYYYLQIPEDINEFSPDYKGDVVHLRFVMYCLPRPFSMKKGICEPFEEVYWHVYNPSHNHLATVGRKEGFNRNIIKGWDITWGDSSCIPGWSFCWLLGDYITVPVFEHDIYLKEKDTYGGSLISFRSAEECFPELQIKNGEWDKLKDPQEASFWEKLPRYLFLLLLIGSAPYMLVVLVLEAFQRHLELPMPESADFAASEGAELRAEVQELVSRYNSLPCAQLRESEETMPVFTDRKQARDFTKKLAAASALPDLTPAEISEINRLGKLRNDLCCRDICGSVRLLFISIIYSIGVWYFFDTYLYFAMPVYYLFTLLCPVYILAHGEPKVLTGIRNMLRGLGVVSAIFAANAASQRFVTKYTDGKNIYVDTDEGVAHIGIAIGILIMVLIFFPLFVLLDGLCNFIRNYLLPK